MTKILVCSMSFIIHLGKLCIFIGGSLIAIKILCIFFRFFAKYQGTYKYQATMTRTTILERRGASSQALWALQYNTMSLNKCCLKGFVETFKQTLSPFLWFPQNPWNPHNLHIPQHTICSWFKVLTTRHFSCSFASKHCSADQWISVQCNVVQ